MALLLVCSRKFLHGFVRCSKWIKMETFGWDGWEIMQSTKSEKAEAPWHSGNVPQPGVQKIDMGSCHTADSIAHSLAWYFIDFPSISLPHVPHHVLRHQGINVVAHRFWVSHLSACSASNLAEDLGRSFLGQEAVGKKNGYTGKMLAILFFNNWVSASRNRVLIYAGIMNYVMNCYTCFMFVCSQPCKWL